MSTTIIAGVELKFPDDEEKKNSICKPMDVPQIPQEFFTSAKTNNEVQTAASKALGFRTLFGKRCNPFAHLGFFVKWRFIIYAIMNRTKIDAKIDMCLEQIEKEK